MGHQSQLGDVAVNPAGKWIASAELNRAIVRLWRMPEGVPLQTLPYAELVNRLRTLTNARVVADRDSANGYRLEFAPFPGWEGQ